MTNTTNPQSREARIAAAKKMDRAARKEKAARYRALRDDFLSMDAKVARRKAARTGQPLARKPVVLP